jgi:hypothetical protein
MIKMLTAYTFEVEDPAIAVREILEHLDLGHNALRNTVGLMFCSLDFISAGIAEAVGKALPFEVMGCTTMGIALPGVADEIILTVAVLTSDEVRFAAGLSEPLVEDEARRIGALYQSLAAPLGGGPPSLILTFQPLLRNIGGDFIVKILDRLSGGSPIFGTGALDVDTALRKPMTLYKGTAYSDRLVLLFLSGCAPPQFGYRSIGEQRTHSQKAIITAAEGNRIISINNAPATVYMERLGLINKGALDMLFAFPIAIESSQDETPTICVIISTTSEGDLICGSNVSVGSILHIGSPSAEAVIKTATDITAQAQAGQGRDLLLLFSCFSRSIALVESSEELNFIQKELADLPIPYLFIYSGGEICPVQDGTGRQHNRFHNFAIVSCGI